MKFVNCHSPGRLAIEQPQLRLFAQLVLWLPARQVRRGACKVSGYARRNVIAPLTAHSDDRDQSFQRIATSVTRVRDGAVGCCF